jgi:hypothetical protein
VNDACRPRVAHVMVYDNTRYTDVAKRGGFSSLGVDRRGRRSSKEVECDILAPLL